MMELLEMVLWIVATPLLFFVGLSWLGYLLGLLSDPYYGIEDVQDPRREKRTKRIKNWEVNETGSKSDDPQYIGRLYA